MAGLISILCKSDKNLSSKKLISKFRKILSRGKNSSSLLLVNNKSINIVKNKKSLLKNGADYEIIKFLVGFVGLNVSSPSEISPILRDGFILFHDGLITNIDVDNNEFRETTPSFSEFLLDKIINYKDNNLSIEDSIVKTLEDTLGNANCLMIDTNTNKLYLFSNHGSLYFKDDDFLYVASEKHLLDQFNGVANQVLGVSSFDFSFPLPSINVKEEILFEYAPEFQKLSNQLDVLEYKTHSLKRCSKCVLPETMPFIRFDDEGICNYCHSYKPRNIPKDKNEFIKILEPYRRSEGYECIVPFSGGRDSCAALHLIINELKLKPITYTYDWGMVTDVGRRNIAIMSGKLGVENIVIADDIEKKRKNIAMNFKAWLKNPDLGMINILTAGDKHFFHYINNVKKDTGVGLNLWGVNPLEVTHFKTGFLGIEPDFERQRVYASGKLGQLRYHAKRLKGMIKSPGYFNTSLWDTYSGEYYRSFAKKTDYYHMFDYWQWNETEINNMLDSYGWEKAKDTPTTWRIGDGTAGIFNYIYYTLAGFTEHDTFRSNQIREGEITREHALKLIEAENVPCFDNIRWYLKSIGFDFVDTIKIINNAKKYSSKLY